MKQFYSHSSCWICWEQRHPNEIPATLQTPYWERCCYCGREHHAGIYIRDHVANTPHCTCVDKEPS